MKGFTLRRRLTALLLVFFILLYSINVSADGITEERKDVKEIIRQGFYRFQEKIDVSDFALAPEELSGIFSSIIKDDPYLFFVNGNMSYSYKPGGFVVSLKPTYDISGEEVFKRWDFCREEIRKIAKNAAAWESDAERALYLHNFVCEEFSYDESLENDNVYDMLKSGKGTCQAYTFLYMALLRECGIRSHFVASDSIVHIWNYLCIDGEWYHSDLTWDDNSDKTSHRHFSISDDTALQRGHKEWYSSINVKCESRKYENFNFSQTLHNRFKVGDVDHNGKSELSDLLLLRRFVSDKSNEGICLLCADVSGNGMIDKRDEELLRKKILIYK